MAERRITVKVDLQAGGNLPQVANAAAAQVGKVQAATKGAAAAAQAVRAGVPAGIPVAQRAPAAAAVAAVPAAARLAATQATEATASRFGAALERLQPAFRAGAVTGGAVLGASYAGIHSVSPVAESHITNSFRMVANEIGIATLPAAVRFTGALQSLSRVIRTVNEATSGWAGSLAFNGALVLTGASALGLAASGIHRAVTGALPVLRWAGIIAEVGAPVAGQAVGQGVAAVARGGARQTATQVATQVGGGAAGGGAVSMLTRVGQFAAPLAYATGILAQIVESGVSTYGAVQDVRESRGPVYDPQAGSFAHFRQRTEQFTGWIPGWGTGLNSLNALINAFSGPQNQVPTHGLGGWAMETALGFIGRGPAATAGAAGAAGGPADLSEATPTVYRSAEDMLDALTMRAAGTPGPLAEQETRSMNEWLRAIHGQLQTLNGTAEQGQTWGPPAGENG